MIRALFAGVLPEPCLSARRKAIFRQVFWRRHTRDLLGGYAAEAIDEPAVDRDGLRAEWRQPHPSSRTALLVQKAWLVTSGVDGDPQGARCEW